MAELRAKWKAEREARGETEGRGSQMLRLVGGTSECITNVPVYITNIVAWSGTNAGWTVMFDIQGGTNGVLWDIFTTTNLVGSHITNSQWFWLERGPSCSTYQYTNQPEEYAFYILGNTNDADGGGLSDAFEQLVTHTDPNNSADDRIVPLVSVYGTDSVAVEQQSTNTARFLVTRLGGYMGLPLTVGCQLSGTASNGVDYYLSPVTTTATNVLVHFAPGQTSVEITLAAVNDSLAEGTEYATLTLTTNVSLCEVNSAHANAAAWILEQYTKVYTTVADFDLGVLAGLEAVGSSLTNVDGRLEFKTNLPPQFPFINVACSGRGTVARINTTNGQVVGEYRTTPAGLQYSGDSGPGPQPSRTTVDLFGNVWVANRADSRTINGTNYGSITRLGLIIGGTRFSKTNGVYYPDPNGQYVALSNATYNTCIDRDGDGFIRTSRGLGDILPWNNGAGVDSAGGVSTAEDEAITEYTRVPREGTRSIAVDRFNDIWVGGRNSYQTHVKVNGLLGLPVPNSAFDAQAGGYGAVIDSLGNLWSAGWGTPGSAGLLRLIPPPPANYPPQAGRDWTNLTTLHGVNSGYGIAVDPRHPYIWQTDNGTYVFRWHTNGTPVLTNGVLQQFDHRGGSQGLAVDTNGHVWVAHGQNNFDVGHLDTNGVWLGNVDLRLIGLRGEYFANTNLAGWPVLTNQEAPIDFVWTNGWPQSPVPTNAFSVRWTQYLKARREGDHIFYVNVNAGSRVRLMVPGKTVGNWNDWEPVQLEFALTNWLGTNYLHSITLEYQNTATTPRIQLSWIEPGTTNRVVIPRSRFYGPDQYQGPTGVSIDTAGKIWAGCWNSNSSVAVRIDPNEGDEVIVNGVTNRVGAVDLVVPLGDGSWHAPPYNQAASPYNYSDMTGFNNRIVNPTLQPLKGYWLAVDDSGNAGQLWNKVSWTAALTNGCAIEVYVRAADQRNDLGSATFVQVTNNVFFPSIRGRYLEVRLGLSRDDPSKQPLLYDLTLHGTSSGFAGELFLYAAWADEGGDGVFWTDLVGAEPMGYQWFRMYPWETNWVQVAGATNAEFIITNVDSWVAWTEVMLFVTNGNGESLWLGPEYLHVSPVPVSIPATNYTTGQGPATRYPMTIRVFGQPTNFNRVSVTVTLWGLTHSRSADLDILLVSPLGTNVMLMSNVGGTNGVSNASLEFRQSAPQPQQASFIPSGLTAYGPSNYGQVSQMPQVGSDPPPVHTGAYSANLSDLEHDNPNGVWKLYIYDYYQQRTGELTGSWKLNFDFE